MAHPAIKASISVTAVSVIYAYILQIKKDRRADKLRDWLIELYPDVYEQLPWLYKKMLRSEIGINVINKRNLIDDELFNIKYRELKEFDNKIYISLGICILGIVFTVVASKYLGWKI